MKAKFETSQGTIEVELFEAEVPKTVSNFVELARSGFYNNLVFHRIVKDFVIQTGDPNTRNGSGNRSEWGTGGSERTVPLEIVSSLHNNVGSLGMARSQDPNSGSSQFYINLRNNSGLDGGYTVFGKITGGMDVAEAIANLSVDQNDAPRSPSEALMKTVSIE
jgi:cyclophilin family peptidyl-prolyl cis-trans isomerase